MKLMNNIHNRAGRYYEYHSTPRIFYVGKLPKTLSKLAGNDDFWRVAA